MTGFWFTRRNEPEAESIKHLFTARFLEWVARTGAGCGNSHDERGRQDSAAAKRWFHCAGRSASSGTPRQSARDWRMISSNSALVAPLPKVKVLVRWFQSSSERP